LLRPACAKDRKNMTPKTLCHGPNSGDEYRQVIFPAKTTTETIPGFFLDKILELLCYLKK
jgi:hypothetical protein